MLGQSVSSIQPADWFNKKNVSESDIHELLIQIGIYPEITVSASKEIALFILEQWIIQSQDTVLLRWTTCQLLASLSKEAMIDFISKINKYAAMKLAHLNKSLMHEYIEYLIHQLDISTLEWLFVTMESGTYPIQVAHLTIPEKKSVQLKRANQLIILMQVNPTEKFYLLQKIKEKLQIEPTHDVYYEAQGLIQLIIKDQLQKKIFPEIISNILLKKSYSNELTNILGQSNTDVISWMLITLSTANNHQSTFLPTVLEQNKLNTIIKQYELDAIIKSIRYILKNRGEINAISIIDEFYSNAISKLDNSSKKWLFTEMIVKNSADIIYIPTPEQERLDICNRLIKITEKSPLLWQDLHKKLIKEIQSDIHNLMSNIYYILCGMTNKMPDKARFWHYIAIMTDTDNILYDLVDNYANENMNKNRVYRYIIPGLTEHFIFLSRTTETMRSFLKTAIMQKNNTSQFDKEIDSLSLYIKSFVQQQLKKLDSNAKHWLFYVLCFNITPYRQIQISNDLFINPPTGMLLNHVNLILNQIYDNNYEIRCEYVKQLLDKIATSEKEHFKRLVSNYCKTIIKNLNTDEQAWLFLTLHYFEIKNHADNFHKEHLLPSDNFVRISQILYMVCLFFDKNNIITDIKNHLIEKNPSFQSMDPGLLEYMGHIIIPFIDPSMLINLVEMNEEQSQKLAFKLSRHMPDFLKSWFVICLTSGCIDSKKIFSRLEQDEIIDTIKTELLLHVSSLLLLALRYDSIKIILVEYFGGNKDNIQNIHTVKLKEFPFGDVGFSILCRSLYSKAEYLTQFSIKKCGLNDKSLLSFMNLLYKAPIKDLSFTDNQLSVFGYKQLLNNLHLHTPLKLATIIAAIIEEMQHTDEMTYLIANLTAEKIFEKRLTALQRLHFASDPQLNTMRDMSNLLLDYAAHYPNIYELISALAKNPNYIAIGTQLIYFSLSSQDQFFIKKMLYHTIRQLQNNEVKNWIKKCLERGEICIPKITSNEFKNIFGTNIFKNELTLTLQIISILVALNATQQNELYQYLGGDNRPLPLIHTLRISKIQCSQYLQSMLILGVSQNINSLKYISLKEMKLSQKNISQLCNALKDSDLLRGLDLSYNIITDKSMSVIINMIQSHHIKYLNLSNCQISNPALEALLKTIPKTKIESLTLKNKMHTSLPRNNPISNINIKYFVDLLKNEASPLAQLNISHNKISTLGLRHLLKAISSNPKTRLTSIALSPQEDMDDGFEYVLLEIEAFLTKKQNERLFNLMPEEPCLLTEPDSKKIIFSSFATTSQKSYISSQQEEIISHNFNRTSPR